MVEALSQFIIGLFAIWLGGVAALCLFATKKALEFLAKMGSTPLIHFGEHVLRALVGLAFVGFATQTSYEFMFEAFGWFIVISSLLIMLAPRRWHHRYAQYWAQALQPWMIRAIGTVTIIAAIFLFSLVI